MADSFGLKIGLEGEKEFKKALADINQSFKVLGSEMKLATSQFDKNDKSVEALAARNKVLRKEIDEQTTKIDTLRKALQNAATSFGENDRRTQNWQIQLNNAEAALNDMNRELDENEKAIKEGGKAAEESGSKFEAFGKVLKTVGVALGAVAVAAGAAAVKLGKEVIAAYADYEQLVGGVDTLFKDSSQEIQRYAANAYKTAGLSANEYMETVTGFSASLIQSLGGDTEKAAKYADMAITDMSDNANKMGTDMSSIQNAYQGFAKQNYTMLDNLKLGYGGTKQEMERLLADAEKISGVKYDISSYADVVEAIHVMQESMDIAGTTAKEAEATISGSVNALKSAVSNLIVGFGDADADMELLCNNMVDAFKTVVANITPVIENIVAALPTALDALLTAVGELLPTLLEAVTELFSQVLETLLSLLPQLIPAAVSALTTIVNTLIENLPLLIDAAVQLVSTLVTGIAEALPTLIPAAVQAIVTIVQGLVDSLPMLLDAALQLITGVYADEAKTGTKDSRADFQRLIADCHAGKIDMVITKSISRFARNTVTLLQTVRDFKAWEVDIFFEEQNIHTMSADGELMLTILASYAQEESRSASENQKWRINRNFEEGMPWNGAMLGYRLKDGRYEIVPKEAALVRRIYNEYLAGDGYQAVAKRLTEEGVPSRFGGKWNQSVVSKILSNYTYTGNLLLQKTFRENHITKKTVINHGELPKYHAEGAHDAIISIETFHAVQTEKARRAAQFNKKPAPRTTYPFTSLLVCDICGKNYRRKTTKTGIVWVCGTFNTLGKSVCASKQIPEATLQQVTAEVLGVKAFTREQLHSRVQSIRVCNGNILVFCFKDGSEVTRTWKDRSRAESWTDEMKEAARRKTLERSKHNA